LEGGGRGDQLPALFRHQRPRGNSDRTTGSLRRVESAGVAARARREGHRVSHRPRRRALGSGRLPPPVATRLLPRTGREVARPAQFGDLANSTKKMIMLVSLASEVNELGYQLKRIAWKNRWYRDFTLNSLTFAIREIIAAFPVYRTYLIGNGAPVPAADRSAI